MRIDSEDHIRHRTAPNTAKSVARFDEFATIDRLEDISCERQRTQKLWADVTHKASATAWINYVYDSTVSWVVITMVGVLIGGNTAFISIVTEWLSDLKLGVCSTGWWLNQKFCCWEEAEDKCTEWRTWDETLLGGGFAVRWVAFVLVGSLMAVVCAHLVKVYSPLAAGSGLPEIKSILAGFVIRGFMGGWTLLMKSVGLALAVASGLSVGKEGPAVHMGCCVGNVVSRNFAKYRRSYARQREIVSAAAAAGVAVAFGAPIGGVLFSLEDLSSQFPLKTLWRSFFCALIATVSLQAMNPFRTGKLVMFQATYDRNWHFFEILFFVLLGIFGGVYGALCIRVNLRVTAFRKKYLANHVVAEVAVLAIITTAVTYLNMYTREDMGELLSYLLQECKDGNWRGICDADKSSSVIWGLATATLIRAIGTACAYGCKVPCGIFVPSMAIGATFGRMLGAIVQELHRTHPKLSLFSQCAPDIPCITPATYAFLGAAGALCGVTKVTVAVVVIMYELTGALNFIVPTVIVVMVARVVGDAIVEGGISEQLILLNGLPCFDEAESLLDLTVADIMQSDVSVIAADGEYVADILHMLSTDVRGFPVVTNKHEMRVVGYVLRSALAREMDAHRELSESAVIGFGAAEESVLGMRAACSFAHIVGTSPIALAPATPAETALEMFKKLGPQAVLVVDAEGMFLGLVSRKDMLRFMRNAE